MEKILNQEEIDALFRATQGRMPQSARSPQRDRIVQPCNLRQAAQITKEQLRSVSMLHETFARNLTHSLGAYLRVTFEVNLVSAEQLTYREFLQRVPEINYVVSFILRPLEAAATLEIDLPLAFPIIDLLLGGPGRPESEVRDITEIEVEILESIVKIISRELQVTWEPVLAVEFVFDQRLRQAQILRLMPLNERVLSLNFEIRTPEARGMLNLVLPTSVASALLKKLLHQGSYRRQRSTGDAKPHLRKLLEHCVFKAELSLPPSPVPARDILSLEVGQILPLRRRINEPAEILVAGKEAFAAFPVRIGNRRAGEVLRSLGAKDSPRKEAP